MILTLASTHNDLSVTVAGLVVDTRHVNQLYQRLEKQLRIEADTIDMLAAEIRLLATKAEVDGISTRIAQAEVSLNEVLGELALRVTYTDLEDELNEVSIILDGKANTIDLNGYVTMEEYQAALAEMETAYASYIMTNEIDAGIGEFGTLIVTGSAAIPHGSFGSIEIGGTSGAWKEQTVVSQLSPVVTKQALSLTDSEGNPVFVDVVTDITWNKGTATITYLGG